MTSRLDDALVSTLLGGDVLPGDMLAVEAHLKKGQINFERAVARAAKG